MLDVQHVTSMVGRHVLAEGVLDGQRELVEDVLTLTERLIAARVCGNSRRRVVVQCDGKRTAEIPPRWSTCRLSVKSDAHNLS